MGRVDGKVAIVTGGASGLGRRTAEVLAGEGAAVVLTDLQAEKGEEVAAAIGGRFMAHDIIDESAWEAVIGETERAFGGLDILVNCAGIEGNGSTVDRMELAEWRRVLSVDLDAVFLGCKHGIKAMKRRGGGSIINISSVAALIGLPRAGHYCAAKAGVHLLTKAVALECVHDHIRCNSIHPGFIRTPMVERALQSERGDRFQAYIERLQPGGQIGEPEDIARGVLYLASDEAKHVTGTELVIDGGIMAT
jgi:NAD(P)-dependent dehydrogenase (short-subunit alcohol dehydrogenase family)